MFLLIGGQQQPRLVGFTKILWYDFNAFDLVKSKTPYLRLTLLLITSLWGLGVWGFFSRIYWLKFVEVCTRPKSQSETLALILQFSVSAGNPSAAWHRNNIAMLHSQCSRAHWLVRHVQCQCKIKKVNRKSLWERQPDNCRWFVCAGRHLWAFS